MIRKRLYTLAESEPRIKSHTASLASFMQPGVPIMWIVLSHRRIRVLVAFSIVFLTLPPYPATLPIARLRCSPYKTYLTFSIWKLSIIKLLILRNAWQSFKSKPLANACKYKNAVSIFSLAGVVLLVLISTRLWLILNRISSFRSFTTVMHICFQLFFSGVTLFSGIGIVRNYLLSSSPSFSIFFSRFSIYMKLLWNGEAEHRNVVYSFYYIYMLDY